MQQRSTTKAGILTASIDYETNNDMQKIIPFNTGIANKPSKILPWGPIRDFAPKSL
jgi:hypothetical protein